MLEPEHIVLQDNIQNPITRPKIKQMILEYLQKRNPKDIHDDIKCEKDVNDQD